MSVGIKDDEEDSKESLLEVVDILEGIDHASKELIRKVLSIPDPPRMTLSEIIRIWEIDEDRDLSFLPGAMTRILRMERGNDRAGMQHILKNHGDEFVGPDIPESKLPELVEAG